MHYHYLEDDNGDLVDALPMCSDACHRGYCQQTDETYEGWTGANEGSEFVDYCVMCGVVAGGLGMAECQTANVVVNRLLSEHGERCDEHDRAHWIQLPASNLEPTERTELVAGRYAAILRANELEGKGWRVVFELEDCCKETASAGTHYRLTISDPMRGRQPTLCQYCKSTTHRATAWTTDGKDLERFERWHSTPTTEPAS